MPERKSSAPGPVGHREFVFTRVFDAPRALVFKAWTDPRRLARWWGPHGFTNPVCELDVRPRGDILIHMRAPDGVVYPMTGQYQEVVERERLVFTSAALDKDGRPILEVVNTVTFSDQAGSPGRTTMTLRARVVRSTAEAAPYVDGMEDGWTQSLERLEGEATQGATGTADREIVITRILSAPRELVFEAWTDPKHLPKWWGPKGFTTTTHAMEVKPGGVWRFCMHGPDGQDYENIVTYLEVARPERLVYQHGSDKDAEPVNFQTTVTFDEEGPGGAKTRLTLRATFPSAAARDFVVKTRGAIEGGKQTLERLAEHLARTSDQASGLATEPAGSEFVITHVVDAPLDLVFKAWTERDRLMRWFGPKGVTITSATIDLRPGGVFHYCMRTPDGHDMWGKWVFREVVPPERLVFVVSFSDEKGGATRHPLSPDWPLEILSTVTFAVHAGKGGGTVVTVRWTAINATAAEQRTFDTGHDSMRQGWTGTFDRLAEYLARP